MIMDSITFHTIWTVFMMASFIALVVWLMSGKQKKAFDDASYIPLIDDSDPGATSSNGGNNHE
ncbi:MAG: cbb3-type cytochrome oxidase subunit 3 [Ketobacter sp.]